MSADNVMEKVTKAPVVKVGSLIEIYNNINKQGADYPYFGINREKDFMPTVANTDGLDNSKYTVLENGMFVFSGMQTGRDVCIRIGLYDKEDPVLISPAYTTFRIKDENIVEPQYLFMNFNRHEMDRYGWFLSDSSIRSNLDWDRFCDIEIPLPAIEVQRELVSVYNGIKALAEENEALLPKLSAACHAFIVDCKKKYEMVRLGEYIEECDERNTEGRYSMDDVKGISTEKTFIETKANLDGVSLASYKIVNPQEFVYVSDTSRRGDKMALALNMSNKGYLISSIYTTFKSKNTENLLPEYLFLQLSRSEFDRYSRFNSWGSARETFDWEEMCRVEIPLPPIEVQRSVVALFNCYEEAKSIAKEAREQLKTICPALVQRAGVEYVNNRKTNK